jgi:membrane-bound lytic murein transglycosylase B
MKKFLAIVCAILISLLPIEGWANPQPFDDWLDQLREDALQQDISAATVNKALANVTIDADVLGRDQGQPEKTITFEEYLQRQLTTKQITRGQELYNEHYQLLSQIHARYAVAPKYILALWGKESRYGGNTGNFNIVEAMVTLAYDGRRADFFRKQLLAALQIIDRGDAEADTMFGSWAGAMGQCQFMPTTFLNYAVDYDGNGKPDIWYSEPDVFASMANYLRAEGWQDDQEWGREVLLARAISANMVGLNVVQPVSAWLQAGVAAADGQTWADRGQSASLIQPDGATGRSYLVYHNFRVLMRWNRSTYFATTIGLLADAIAP